MFGIRGVSTSRYFTNSSCLQEARSRSPSKRGFLKLTELSHRNCLPLSSKVQDSGPRNVSTLS